LWCSIQTWQERTIAIIHLCSLLVIVAVARCINRLPRALLLKKKASAAEMTIQRTSSI
jgi:hypothetical protein